MNIKIQTKTTKLPIEIGELKFGFDVTDKSIKEFRENALKVQQELNEIKIDENADNIEEIKGVLKRGFDVMLGDGSFDKVYEQTPSVMVIFDYFQEVAAGITEYLEERQKVDDQQGKVRKYLQQKNKGK